MALFFSDVESSQNSSIALAANTSVRTIDPADFSGDFKTLLEEIKVVEESLLSGDIATYAGYPEDATLSRIAANEDTGKLTFIIMFRLPYTKTAYNKYYGNPLGSNKSWSKRANDYRLLKGLKKLNAKGEKVNSSGSPIDGSGNVIAGDYTGDNAYTEYVDFNNLSNGKSYPKTLTDQAVISEIKDVPIYFFLTVYTENLPQTFNRSFHFPENIIGEEGEHKSWSPSPEYEKRDVVLTRSNSAHPGLWDSLHLHDSSSAGTQRVLGSDVKYDGATQTLYGQNVGFKSWLTLNPRDEVTMYGGSEGDINNEYYSEILNVKRMRIDEYVNGSVIAERLYPSYKTWVNFISHFRKNKKGYDGRKYRRIANNDSSGITFGLGIDLGASHASKGSYYDWKFSILKFNNISSNTPGISTFRLRAGWDISDEIAFTASNDELQKIIANLYHIDLDFVNVTKNKTSDNDYDNGWEITIQRHRSTYKQNPQKSGNDFYNTCDVPIFYHREFELYTEVTPNIIIKPNLASDRLIPRLPKNDTDSKNIYFGKKQYDLFVEMMNEFYSNGNWLDPSHHHAGFDANELERVMKLGIGLNKGPAYVVFKNYENIIDKFQFVNYGRALKITHSYKYVPNQRVSSLGYLKKYDANIESRMNLAEQFVLNALIWGSYVKTKDNAQKLVNAIHAHDLKALKNIVISTHTKTVFHRRDFMLYHLDRFKPKFYENLD